MSADDLSVELVNRRGIPLDLRFNVRAGELLALVGPSGSGKTTTLRAIAGLLRPTHGLILCQGAPWLDTRQGIALTPQQRRVGMVFQDYALFPHLTALDNLRLAMDDGDTNSRRQRAMELLRMVRLEGLEGRYPSQLSGGQQQRVAVARALARRPRVLLLDEPFSAVDMMTRQRLQRELALLRQSINIPIVLVTHDLQEARALADRICVLHQGNSLQTDAPDTLFREPRSARVARLLGQPNLCQGLIRHSPAGLRLSWNGRLLELHQPPELADGARVDWYIPESDIILHRRERPSQGERENPINGIVEECITLGVQTSVTLRCGESGERLRFNTSTHAARRNGLVPGITATVSLLSQGIHLMAPSTEISTAEE
ncbi:MAG: ABC transporter ATP-binding protein [Ectothiorhodospiraceae bacterium]|nr:ABC transporter ATP-binding protein [Ectothiorhodospiraceae bacterium]